MTGISNFVSVKTNVASVGALIFGGSSCAHAARVVVSLHTMLRLDLLHS